MYNYNSISPTQVKTNNSFTIFESSSSLSHLQIIVYFESSLNLSQILVKFSLKVKIDFVHYLEEGAKNEFDFEILLPLTLIEKKQKQKGGDSLKYLEGILILVQFSRY